MDKDSAGLKMLREILEEIDALKLKLKRVADTAECEGCSGLTDDDAKQCRECLAEFVSR